MLSDVEPRSGASPNELTVPLADRDQYPEPSAADAADPALALGATDGTGGVEGLDGADGLAGAGVVTSTTNCWVLAEPSRLLAVTTKVERPAEEGVPDRTPVPGSKVRPDGRDPEVTEKIDAGYPVATNV